MIILLGSSAAIGWGAADFFGGALRRDLPVFAVVAVSQLFGLLLLVPVLAWHDHPFPHDPRILYGLGAGVGVSLELRLIYLAISRGDAFITAPVGALGVTLAVIVGFLGGDPLSLPIAVGLALALAGGLSSTWASPKRPSSPLAAAGFSLGAAVGLATALVCLHASGRVDPYWSALLVDLGTLVSSGLAMLVGRRPGRSRPLPGLRRLSVLAVPASAGVGGDLAYAAASQHGALSVAAGLSSLYPLVTMALGILIQGRRAAGREAAGLALALAGAVLLGVAAG